MSISRSGWDMPYLALMKYRTTLQYFR